MFCFEFKHPLESNVLDIRTQIEQLSVTDPDAYALNYNTLIGQIHESYFITCQNPCEQCFRPIDSYNTATKQCASFTSDDVLVMKVSKSNFTFDEIPTGDPSDFATIEYSSTHCIQYTDDQYDDSKVCMKYVEIIPSDSIYCNVTFNDVLCNFCTISPDTYCVVAYCTNVDAIYGTEIDICQRLEVGVHGPFQILSIWYKDKYTAFTPGTCDIDGLTLSEKSMNGPTVSKSESNTNISTLSWSINFIVMASIAVFHNFD
jgi:hypothetical protein